RKGINVSNESRAEISIKSMFKLFLTEKSVEGLSERTIDDYNIHFGYLLDFLGKDISNIKFNKYLFQSYIAYILHEKGLSPITANVRIRTIRAFLRYCYLNGY